MFQARNATLIVAAGVAESLFCVAPSRARKSVKPDHGKQVRKEKTVNRSVFVPLVLFAAFGLLGQLETARATITSTGDVDPANPSLWTLSTTAYVGKTADGSVTVSKGGIGNDLFSKTAFIGYDAGVTGLVTVTGNGSTWTSLGLYVGYDGIGTLNVTLGGDFDSGGATIAASGGSGTVMVDGIGSTWTSNSSLVVGDHGDATLAITGGGSVENSKCYIAKGVDALGTVMVDGIGSTWTSYDSLTVGYYGDGTLAITGGGSVTSDSSIIAYDGGSVGRMTVDGVGSMWTNNYSLDVGREGHGTLTITGGGNVASGDGSIGFDGSVTVAGTGSKWTLDGDLDFFGGGVLMIHTGGMVDAGAMLNLRSAGTLNLDAGMIRAARFDFTAGTFHFNSGTLQDTDDLTISPGDNVLGNSHTILFARHLRVDGTTTLDDVLILDGGTFSTGSLVNPGQLQFARGTFNLTSDNLVIGTGGLLGSTLTLPNTKAVGVTNQTTIQTSGQLALRGGTFSSGGLHNEGIIDGSGQINAPLDNASTGVVRVFTGDHQTISGAGNTNDGRIQLFGGGLEFTQGLTNNAGAFVSGNGTLVTGSGLLNQGTLNFAGTANLNGPVTNAVGGKIISGGGGATIFYDDVVNNGEIRTSTNGFTVFFGAVSGAGTFTGTGTVNFEGDLMPGNSPAAVYFAGDVVLGPDATLQIELGGTVAGTDHDQIIVAGELTLDGTLEISLNNGFTPSAGQTFDLLNWGSVVGVFSSVVLPSLEGLAWDTSQLSTGVLSVVPDLPGDFNGDGKVDAADYIVWRKNPGGIYTQNDYTVWRTHFGQTAGSGAALPSAESLSAAVPEPASALLLTFGVAVGSWRRRRIVSQVPTTHRARRCQQPTL